MTNGTLRPPCGGVRRGRPLEREPIGRVPAEGVALAWKTRSRLASIAHPLPSRARAALEGSGALGRKGRCSSARWFANSGGAWLTCRWWMSRCLSSNLGQSVCAEPSRSGRAGLTSWLSFSFFRMAPSEAGRWQAGSAGLRCPGAHEPAASPKRSALASNSPKTRASSCLRHVLLFLSTARLQPPSAWAPNHVPLRPRRPRPWVHRFPRGALDHPAFARCPPQDPTLVRAQMNETLSAAHKTKPTFAPGRGRGWVRAPCP